MPTNQISLGSLNRIRASVTYSSNAGLNITNANLGKAGISMRPLTNASDYIEAMAGGIPSPMPFQVVEITIHALRTTGLGVSYRTQVESTTVVGDVTVKPDSSTMPNYPIANCVIMNATNDAFNGTSPDFVIVLHGAYYINANLFNAA